MNKQINLLPNIKQERLREHRLRQLSVSISLVVLAAAVGLPLVLLGVKAGQGLYLSRVQTQIEERQQTIKSTPNITTILTVKDHLNSLPSLYANRLYVSQLFSLFPSVIPKDVNLNSAEIDTTGAVRFTGVAPSYALVEKFYDGLAQIGVDISANLVEPDPNAGGYFTNVVLESVSGPSGSEVSFVISANFNTDLIRSGQ